jgi:hypothetical protein
MVAVLTFIPSFTTFVEHLHFQDSIVLIYLIPTFGAHRVLSLKTTLTMPHPSEGSHRAFDHKQPPTQVIPTTIEVAEQPTSDNNPDIQPRQDNIITTTARTNQNDGGVSYNPSSPRTPPPQVINKKQKQETT